MSAVTTIAGFQAPKDILKSIQHASVSTGVDFSYLVQQAKAESSFDASAKAKTSSAEGLFQFIDSTWMNMVEKHGAKYGLDGLSREEVLAKRKDPNIASLMAAELAKENKAVLEAKTNIDPKATDLYFAHFLGANGASEFLNARTENGDSKAAYLFPAAAKANQGVFFNKDGTSRTLDEVYAFFDKKFQTPASEIAAKAPVIDKKPVRTAQAVETSQHVKVSPRIAAAYYKTSPSAALEGFDTEIQQMVMSSLFMDMQMLQKLRSESTLMTFNTGLPGANSPFSAAMLENLQN